jgi:hypothetical protein
MAAAQNPSAIPALLRRIEPLLRRGPAAPLHLSPGQTPRQLPLDARKLPEASTLDLYASSGRNSTETHRR